MESLCCDQLASLAQSKGFVELEKKIRKHKIDGSSLALLIQNPNMIGPDFDIALQIDMLRFQKIISDSDNSSQLDAASASFQSEQASIDEISLTQGDN